jgi:RES domain
MDAAPLYTRFDLTSPSDFQVWLISRRIARDDRVHIEYVPTQVVTEYVRTAVKIDARRVDGIRYQSSRRKAQTALVLFADQEHLILEKAEQPEFYHLAKDRWLKLVRASAKSVTTNDIAGWATRGGGLFGDL